MRNVVCLLITFSELEPTYSIKRYQETIYSVTKFKRSHMNLHLYPDEISPNDNKMDNAFSRARTKIKEYGLCNPWDYFVTLTLDKEKYDRYQLATFKSDLTRFACDVRKKYSCYTDKRLSYVFVPETHKDGAWHMHGFLYGLPDCAVRPFERGRHPDYLVDHGFLNWPDYASKFGFVSLGVIRDQLSTVLYTTKYISKDVEALLELKGQHLYIPSRPLKTSDNIVDVYGNNPELDSLLSNHYKFCSTGLVTGVDWVWPLQFDQTDEPLYPKTSPPEPLRISDSFLPETVDPSCQLNFFRDCEDFI